MSTSIAFCPNTEPPMHPCKAHTIVCAWWGLREVPMREHQNCLLPDAGPKCVCHSLDDLQEGKPEQRCGTISVGILRRQ